jgi:hypothetical protein
MKIYKFGKSNRKNCLGYYWIEESPDGDYSGEYVKLEDYNELKDELKRCREMYKRDYN